ncbi:MAG TPA: molybdenum cofactor biosynthesis protein MoaE [Dehalococcoidia bacterium]|nr:molybdenum cofactor biosynthesis protein MoaE [Dehalococcoidia bacterium]
MTFEIIEKPIDVTELIQTLRDDSAGACASFEGWERNTNEGQDVTSLEYEDHGPLAVSEGEAILAEALERFELLAKVIAYRFLNTDNVCHPSSEHCSEDDAF